MHSLFVHPTPDRCLSREDSDSPISSLCYRLSSWHRHTEDVIPDEYLSLEIAECVDRCSIAGEDHYISSPIMEPLDSCDRERSDLVTTTVSVGSIVPIHLEDHLDVWEFFLELSHHDLSTESRVKKSDTHRIKRLCLRDLHHPIFLASAYYLWFIRGAG
jgi:hypothetical protein